MDKADRFVEKMMSRAPVPTEPAAPAPTNPRRDIFKTLENRRQRLLRLRRPR